MKERYGRSYIYHMEGKTYYIYLTDHERDLFEQCHGIVLHPVDAPKN